MLLGIDHLVVAVRDPDAEAERLERELGIAFTGGGRHEGSGTFNRLAFLGDAYLELIGVFDRGLVEAPPGPGGAAASPGSPVGPAALTLLDAGREGLATYALASDDVAGDVARLRAAGSPIGEPVAGSRVRPDGDVVRWLTAFGKLGPEAPPFLIEHELVGAEWGDEARRARATFVHPAGGPARLTALEPPVADRPAVAAEYESTVGLAFGSGFEAVLGPHRIRLAGRDASDAATVEIAVRGGTATEARLTGIGWRLKPG